MTPLAARADAWELTREPPKASARKARARAQPQSTQATGSALLRERYLRVLLGEPLQDFAFERLLALCRERDGNLDALASELAARKVDAKQEAALLLVRGRVDAARAQPDAAASAYQRALALAPSWSAPYEALAELERAAGQLQRATALYEQASARSKGEARSALLRKLAELALDGQDFEAAARHYAALAAQAKGGIYAATQYARELDTRGHHARAVAAYEDALRLLTGDSRGLPPVLLELSRAQLKADDGQAALESLYRARKLAPPETGTRAEIDAALLDTYRHLGGLREFAQRLEESNTRTPADDELLGRVYDELGDHDAALRALRRALAKRPSRIDARRLVIAILSRQGQIDQVIAEYRALLRVAPREPKLVVELAKLLMEAGQRAEALRLLAEADRRFARDASIKRALFDVYSRWNEPALATRALRDLSRIDPDDASHIVALGEQQLQQGDEAAALATWHRVLTTGQDRARAHATLGETFLDHDMAQRALPEFESAVRLDPRNVDYLRGHAEALQRLARTQEAAARWLQVLHLAGEDRALRHQARQRVVRLWALTGELPRHVTELERAFVKPEAPDLEAGRFLAEAYRAMAAGRRQGQGEPRYLEAAERVLSRLVELAPGDLESLQGLERARAQRGDLAGAIDVLKRLLDADPKQAQAYLTRMAEYSLSLYRDDDALAYAERLLALAPTDARAHARLGDLYRARQDIARAIASYEQAVALDKSAFELRLQLAELLVSVAELRKADVLLREVLRQSTDDELVSRAARALLQINHTAAEQHTLEQLLLPLALSNPGRPIYRRILVELLAAIARPLALAADGTDAQALAARAELTALGQRAIKPLLEALADVDLAQRGMAVDLLGRLRNPYAAIPLLSVAEQGSDTALRRRALLGAAALATTALAPRFVALAGAPERRLRDAAAFGLARMTGPNATAHMRALLTNNFPPVRALALLGLGRERDAAALEAMRTLLRTDRSAVVRAAAAVALGMSQDRAALGELSAALSTERGDAALAAALALGMLGDRNAVTPLSRALFASDPSLRRAALWSLRWLARDDGPFPMAPELLAPEHAYALRPWLVRFWLAEPTASVAQAFHTFESELTQAARVALSGNPEAVRAALLLLSGADAVLAAEPSALGFLQGALRTQLSALTAHVDPSVRAAALRLLLTTHPAEATTALVAALEDRDTAVQGIALDAIGAGAPVDSAAVHDRLTALAGADPRWWIRRRAVLALGRGGPAAAARLVEVLRSDAYAYVREAAASALGSLRDPSTLEPLKRAQTADPEPQVRRAAAQALLQIQRPVADR